MWQFLFPSEFYLKSNKIQKEEFCFTLGRTEDETVIENDFLDFYFAGSATFNSNNILIVRVLAVLTM